MLLPAFFAGVWSHNFCAFINFFVMLCVEVRASYLRLGSVSELLVEEYTLFALA